MAEVRAKAVIMARAMWSNNVNNVYHDVMQAFYESSPNIHP